MNKVLVRCLCCDKTLPLQNISRHYEENHASGRYWWFVFVTHDDEFKITQCPYCSSRISNSRLEKHLNDNHPLKKVFKFQRQTRDTKKITNKKPPVANKQSEPPVKEKQKSRSEKPGVRGRINQRVNIPPGYMVDESGVLVEITNWQADNKVEERKLGHGVSSKDVSTENIFDDILLKAKRAEYNQSKINQASRKKPDTKGKERVKRQRPEKNFQSSHDEAVKYSDHPKKSAKSTPQHSIKIPREQSKNTYLVCPYCHTKFATSQMVYHLIQTHEKCTPNILVMKQYSKQYGILGMANLDEILSLTAPHGVDFFLDVIFFMAKSGRSTSIETLSKSIKRRKGHFCPLCDNQLIIDYLPQHIEEMHRQNWTKRRKPLAENQLPKRSKNDFGEKQESAPETYNQSFDDSRDASKPYAHRYREHGKFGSHPIHDAYGDESDTD